MVSSIKILPLLGLINAFVLVNSDFLLERERTKDIFITSCKTMNFVSF
jgi:hypothetical protein